MIHGGCTSAGCYAMTDEQMAEIYALARELFFGGQTSFQLQAYPFRMTPLNMAKHRNSPHMAFWKMIKEGYDHFEVTHLEPRVGVCERRYILRMNSTDRLNPAERCPAYGPPEDIATSVREKQRRDDTETAELINRGHPERTCHDRPRWRYESDLPREGKIKGSPAQLVSARLSVETKCAPATILLSRSFWPPRCSSWSVIGGRRFLAGHPRRRIHEITPQLNRLHQSSTSIILLVFSRLKERGEIVRKLTSYMTMSGDVMNAIYSVLQTDRRLKR